MQTLKGNTVYLRALEPDDLDFLFNLENDESVWEISNTTTPYSRYVLNEYLKNSHRDLYEVKQLRMVICLNEGERTIGFIDLFDFEPKHSRVGVGIIIFAAPDRGKGYAVESLELLKKYAKKHLHLHQLYANITEDNERSVQLFEKVGFMKCGEKKDWIKTHDGFKNEFIYQLLLDVH